VCYHFKTMIVFVLGGARSGKTNYALSYAEDLFGIKNFYYIATAEPIDDEMKKRIEKHKKERGEKWNLVEESLFLSKVLSNFPEKSAVVIDCIGVWITNLLVKLNNSLNDELEKFFSVLKSYKTIPDVYLICVSSEVGLSVVPESSIGRYFRDLLGEVNQKLARLSDEAFFVVAGYPIPLKTL